jgi:hypothetical protein
MYKLDLELMGIDFNIEKFKRDFHFLYFTCRDKQYQIEIDNDFYIKIPTSSYNIKSLIKFLKNYGYNPKVIIAKCGFYYKKDIEYFKRNNDVDKVYPLFETDDIFKSDFIKNISRINLDKIFIGRNDLQNIMNNIPEDIENICSIIKTINKNTYIGGFTDKVIEERKAGDNNSCRYFIISGIDEKEYNDKQKEYVKRLHKKFVEYWEIKK